MNAVGTIFRRELTSYFSTPVAYVFIVMFLVLTGVFTFYIGNFYERGQANFALKDFRKAIKDFKRCLELDPSRDRKVQPLIDEAQRHMESRKY